MGGRGEKQGQNWADRRVVGGRSGQWCRTRRDWKATSRREAVVASLESRLPVHERHLSANFAVVGRCVLDESPRLLLRRRANGTIPFVIMQLANNHARNPPVPGHRMAWKFDPNAWAVVEVVGVPSLSRTNPDAGGLEHSLIRDLHA